MSFFQKVKNVFKPKPKTAPPPTDAEVAAALRSAGITHGSRDPRSGYNVFEGSGGALAGTSGQLLGYKPLKVAEADEVAEAEKRKERK